MTTLTGNINRAGQQKRRIGGIVSLVIGGMLIVVLNQAGAGRWWRVLTFPSFWLGALGLIQAQARTCVAFAAAGTCELDDGTRRPLDAETAQMFKARARKINIGAFVFALVATAVAVAL